MRPMAGSKVAIADVRAYPMCVQHISAVTLAVREMARSVEFYQVLGFNLVYGGPIMDRIGDDPDDEDAALDAAAS